MFKLSALCLAVDRLPTWSCSFSPDIRYIIIYRKRYFSLVKTLEAGGRICTGKTQSCFQRLFHQFLFPSKNQCWELLYTTIKIKIKLFSKPILNINKLSTKNRLTWSPEIPGSLHYVNNTNVVVVHPLLPQNPVKTPELRWYKIAGGGELRAILGRSPNAQVSIYFKNRLLSHRVMTSRGLSRTQMLAAPTVHVLRELPLANHTNVSMSRTEDSTVFCCCKTWSPHKSSTHGSYSSHNVDKEIYN